MEEALDEDEVAEALKGLRAAPEEYLTSRRPVYRKTIHLHGSRLLKDPQGARAIFVLVAWWRPSPPVMQNRRPPPARS